MSKHDFLDAVDSMSGTMRLAEVNRISVRDASRLILKELGWSDDGPPEQWKFMHRQGPRPEQEVAYQIAMALTAAADELGAPMDPMRLVESAA
tara:strand:+ start:3024 stop:3302 length:279 start_codon:yes stop_codon:yes gene_type:complete